jgi:hypothetical protein
MRWDNQTLQGLKSHCELCKRGAQIWIPDTRVGEREREREREREETEKGHQMKIMFKSTFSSTFEVKKYRRKEE